ncbi:MAG: DUF5060 domain-containing protein [Coraliomargaritaceae bacterium]
MIVIRLRTTFHYLLLFLIAEGSLLANEKYIRILGNLNVWHKITLQLEGPLTGESATPNPFTDYRMDVTFTHPQSDTLFTVPGFFAADGNAAHSGAATGNKWHCYLRPNLPGTWHFSISFRQGTDVATDLSDHPGKEKSPYDGISGRFDISDTSTVSAPDLRARGRLQYVGRHHLQFQGDGRYFLKFGPDSPENFLEYDGFDNTPSTEEGHKGIRHTFPLHRADYKNDGQTWQNGKGKNILGALNYLAETGANSISMILNNIGRLVENPDKPERPFAGPGDGDRAFPYTSKDERLRFDCSKLDQWEIVFDHAELKGLHLHFKLGELENARDLDYGNPTIGPERKLYYREMVARFGHHLALNWNISEEIPVGSQTREAWMQHLEKIDPWQSHRVFHTGPSPDKGKFYTPHLGQSYQTGVSLQTPEAIDTKNVFHETKLWRDRSRTNGHAWVVACDEQGPGNLGVRQDYPLSRKNVLWGNLMAGGAGVEYYNGGRDLNMEDYREFNALLAWSNYAINDFFYKYSIPFWRMSNDDSIISNPTAHCLTDHSEYFVIYLPNGGTAELNLENTTGTFSVLWFDPRNGGSLLEGSIRTISGNGTRTLGNAPNNVTEDWAILVKKRQG